MKNILNNLFWVLGIAVVVSACYPEQEVAPIVPPTNNPVATIERIGDFPASIGEGDTLMWRVTTDKFANQDMTFGPLFSSSSTADASDVEVYGDFPAFTKENIVMIIILDDDEVETAEVFDFTLDARYDRDFSFQLNENASDTDPVSTTIRDLEYNLVWDGSYDDETFCDWGVDLDMYFANADFSLGEFSTASGDCPEIGSLEALSGLGDETYDIYIDFWSMGSLSGLSGIEVPYSVSIANNSGEGGVYTFSGSFQSENEGADTHIVGQLVVSGETMTLYDEDGNLMGTI